VPEIRPPMALEAWCAEQDSGLKLNLHPRAHASINTLPLPVERDVDFKAAFMVIQRMFHNRQSQAAAARLPRTRFIDTVEAFGQTR
ncbi:hypothetical protein MJL79_29790, partial [Salmonella enterica subsp. enterica serovar Montevideo]|nr:hypothetical protein [Salmonella enterica subsp. enterica serovar Montevideo]